MDSSNPYRPPTSLNDATPIELPKKPAATVHRKAALIALGMTTLSAASFTFITETHKHVLPPPGLILLIATGLIAVVVALFTADLIVSPQCCFTPMFAGDVVAGLITGWDYAAPLIMLPMAAGGSTPALVVAFVRRRITKRKQSREFFSKENSETN